MAKKAVLIPIYNESRYIEGVLRELRVWHKCDVIVVNDGSSDRTAEILAQPPIERLTVISHTKNQGYGSSLIDGFRYATERDYESVVTMDCDWQHEPHYVPAFFEALEDADVVSGSRYLRELATDTAAPSDRKAINGTITKLINDITGFGITDAFCGFKGYRTSALKKLSLSETGYAFPLQFWIQARHVQLSVKELAVPRIYIDPKRSFGGNLDDPEKRLAHYRAIIETERSRWKL